MNAEGIPAPKELEKFKPGTRVRVIRETFHVPIGAVITVTGVGLMGDWQMRYGADGTDVRDWSIRCSIPLNSLRLRDLNHPFYKGATAVECQFSCDDLEVVQ